MKGKHRDFDGKGNKHGDKGEFLKSME